MPEYIEREAFLKVLRGSAVAKYPLSFVMGLYAAADELVKFPAADVVAVVRCKDCHFSCDEGDDGAVWCKNWNQYIGCDCFCSHGERRGEDG